MTLTATIAKTMGRDMHYFQYAKVLLPYIALDKVLNLTPLRHFLISSDHMLSDLFASKMMDAMLQEFYGHWGAPALS